MGGVEHAVAGGDLAHRPHGLERVGEVQSGPSSAWTLRNQLDYCTPGDSVDLPCALFRCVSISMAGMISASADSHWPVTRPERAAV